MSDFTSALNSSGQSVPWPANPALRLSTAGSGLLAAQCKVDYNRPQYPGGKRGVPAPLTPRFGQSYTSSSAPARGRGCLCQTLLTIRRGSDGKRTIERRNISGR